MFGRFEAPSTPSRRETGKREVRNLGEIFCYQARGFAWDPSRRDGARLRIDHHALAALGAINTIARNARAVPPQDMLRAATASNWRSGAAFASSDP
ncbi:hypothetical protein Bsp3421_005447 [Burkholderia sp. FERM BP-3421]|jgi:hypothetical protein|uniref:hypothetical protein n=1 Tax=Burkholderia sp. FERM BP-3421 TaxID=1494466 RepID=UPI0020962234|nr:hypothetical protein [Burkholderia sp. FERM BP-3421]WDD95281.1 hypothetical protein Bsp3421_005447 [Burkholderia sp. FERM BP-3421]